MYKRIGLPYAIAVLIVLAFALARIADTYRVFNHTNDEIAHIGTGMEWWDGQYNQDLTHPPMRAVFAVGPRLLGIHAFGEAKMRDEGLRVLYDGGDYKRTLTAARIGALPFFLLTLAVVGIWAARIAGPVGGAHGDFLRTPCFHSRSRMRGLRPTIRLSRARLAWRSSCGRCGSRRLVGAARSRSAQRPR